MPEYKFNAGLFQNLTNTNQRWNSPETDQYNCIAFAAGDQTRPWWPFYGNHWPLPFPPEDICDLLDSFIDGFKSLGYEPCDNGELENGYEKIALYGIEKKEGVVVKHAAIQLINGEWGSKMGAYETDPDIIHSKPDDISGVLYGGVVKFLKRKREPTAI